MTARPGGARAGSDDARGLEVVVVAYGSASLLRECLEALENRYRVVVVDNSSSTEVRTVALELAARYLDPGRNLGFAAGVNYALRDRRPDDDVLLLNPDARITVDGIEQLRAGLLAEPRAACAAPAQRAPGSTTLDRVRWPFPSPGRAWVEALGLGRLVRAEDFLIGSILLVRASALADVGGFDERYFLYAEECDWQLRARERGWSMLYCREVVAAHVGAGTGGDPVRREQNFQASQQRLIEKWHGPMGWQVYRAANLVGAAARAMLRRGDARSVALRRAMLYTYGPIRVLERHPGDGDRDRPGGTARLRIVHVVCTDNFAGVERYVVTLASAHAALGYDVTVLGGASSRMPEELAGTAVEWRPAPTVSAAVRALWRLGGVDIVHAHMFDAELASVLAMPRTGRRIVATRHFARRRGSTLPARLVGRVLTRLMTVQLAISHFVADRTEGSSLVVEPGVCDVDAPPSATVREDIVLMLQRLDREKNGEVGIEAFASSGLAARGWRLLVAGGGDDRDRLERAAVSAGIGDACEFLGPTTETHALLSRAAIFLATRPDEPYGLSVVEAMAAAVPVVAAGGGGHLETVGRAPEAALYPPGDTYRAAALLSELADDAAWRERYGAALRDLQRSRFTARRQADETLAVYLDLWCDR